MSSFSFLFLFSYFFHVFSWHPNPKNFHTLKRKPSNWFPSLLNLKPSSLFQNSHNSFKLHCRPPLLIVTTASTTISNGSLLFILWTTYSPSHDSLKIIPKWLKLALTHKSLSLYPKSVSLSLSSLYLLAQWCRSVVEICIPTMGLWVVSFVDLGLWCMLIFGFVGLWCMLSESKSTICGFVGICTLSLKILFKLHYLSLL